MLAESKESALAMQSETGTVSISVVHVSTYPNPIGEAHHARKSVAVIVHARRASAATRMDRSPVPAPGERPDIV